MFLGRITEFGGVYLNFWSDTRLLTKAADEWLAVHRVAAAGDWLELDGVPAATDWFTVRWLAGESN